MAGSCEQANELSVEPTWRSYFKSLSDIRVEILRIIAKNFQNCRSSVEFSHLLSYMFPSPPTYSDMHNLFTYVDLHLHFTCVLSCINGLLWQVVRSGGTLLVLFYLLSLCTAALSNICLITRRRNFLASINANVYHYYKWTAGVDRRLNISISCATFW
jgi:hypothetical protein